MPTTLDRDDDVLRAAKELAKAEGKTMGTVISELARQALTTPTPDLAEAQVGLGEGAARRGGPVWHTLPHREAVIVAPGLIERIQDEIDLEDAMAWDHDADQPRRP